MFKREIGNSMGCMTHESAQDELDNTESVTELKEIIRKILAQTLRKVCVLQLVSCS